MSQNLAGQWRSSLARLTPQAVRRRLWVSAAARRRRAAAARLDALRRRCTGLTTGALMPYLDHTVQVNDGPNFYTLYKDIVVRRIYHFEAVRSDPRILDCGGNIGLSILYYKHVYPRARVVGFEPDPAIFPLLERNIRENGVEGVELHHAAVAGRSGSMTFWSDGRYGSCLGEYLPSDAGSGWARCDVPCIALDEHLAEPVDYLKMNIEGAEWETLAACGERLRQVREMVIEYHHLPGLPRTLHRILELLDRQGFEYLVNDLDDQTNPGATPPFRLTPESRYYLLIYAMRRDAVAEAQGRGLSAVKTEGPRI